MKNKTINEECVEIKAREFCLKGGGKRNVSNLPREFFNKLLKAYWSGIVTDKNRGIALNQKITHIISKIEGDYIMIKLEKPFILDEAVSSHLKKETKNEKT